MEFPLFGHTTRSFFDFSSILSAFRNSFDQFRVATVAGCARESPDFKNFTRKKVSRIVKVKSNRILPSARRSTSIPRLVPVLFSPLVSVSRMIHTHTDGAHGWHVWPRDVYLLHFLRFRNRSPFQPPTGLSLRQRETPLEKNPRENPPRGFHSRGRPTQDPCLRFPCLVNV